MNDYEIVYIFDSALEQPAVEQKLDALHGHLTGDGNGEITAVDHWGRRRLAYPIRKHENGYYVVIKASVDPTVLPEFERALKLEEGLLRHLIVIDEGVPTAPMSIATREPRDEDGEDEDEDEEEEE